MADNRKRIPTEAVCFGEDVKFDQVAFRRSGSMVQSGFDERCVVSHTVV
jgi:hypothetical protein